MSKNATNRIFQKIILYDFYSILAFSTDAIEFRYAVNGSLLQTLYMPELKLISAKVNIIKYN